MIRYCLLGICLSLISFAFAEGSRELMPDNNGVTYMQFNEQIQLPRDFAKVGADSLFRLYIHIANEGEYINLGFNRLSTAGSAYFQIRNPDDEIVYGPQLIPSSGVGYISSFAQAEAGPSTLVGGDGGYNPFVYEALDSGNYYIEFYRTGSGSSSRHLFRYFDITVSDAIAGNLINGRVWAHAWDLNTNSFSNRSYAVFLCVYPGYVCYRG